MTKQARSTRGGPVPARIAFALLLLSLAIVSGFGAGGAADVTSASAVAERVRATAEPFGPKLRSEPHGPTEAAFVPGALPAVAAAAPEHFRVAFANEVDTDEFALYAGPHEPTVGVIEGELERGQTLSSALDFHGVRPSTVHAISSELFPLFDFHRAQPGQQYRLVLDAEGQLLEFDYQINADESVHLARSEDGRYQAIYDKSELVPHVVRMAGVVTSSLYSAIEALGEDPSLASAFAAVFAWEFDFNRSVRPGDEFHVLYERLYRETRDGRQHYVRPGQILAARYRSGNRELEALHFEPEQGGGGY